MSQCAAPTSSTAKTRRIRLTAKAPTRRPPIVKKSEEKTPERGRAERGEFADVGCEQ